MKGAGEKVAMKRIRGTDNSHSITAKTAASPQHTWPRGSELGVSSAGLTSVTTQRHSSASATAQPSLGRLAPQLQVPVLHGSSQRQVVPEMCRVSPVLHWRLPETLSQGRSK